MNAMAAAIADGFGQHWKADVLRLAVIAGCLWLAALVIRIAWVKRRAAEKDEPHLFTSMSYAAVLVLISIERVERWNLPADWHLFGSLAIVAFGMVGVLTRFRIKLRPPWKRRRRDELP